MNSKIVLITGANSGIGKATAIQLAQQGKTLVLVCRSQQRGEVALKEIIAASSNQNVFLHLCDLSSHASIVECTKGIRQKFDYIDVLINNAGAIFGKHQLTVDGLEQSFGLNHMGYFLFTHYLLDLIKAGNDKRIVNVSSLAHKMVAFIPWGDLQLCNVKYSQLKAYALSKLYNIYFTKVLAQKLSDENTGITVNCLHPGTIYSGFGASGSKFFANLVKVGGPLLGKPASGAKTSVFLATSDKVDKVTGQYFAHRRKAWVTSKAKDMKKAERLWERSMQLAGIGDYGVVL
jgi:NAD(P)-dependent dehydrogenase (short-subunit alcohol dehydrogenase family)